MSAAPITFSEIGGIGLCAKPSLLAQARSGNREAFAQMVSPYMTTVYLRARRLTGNPADAEDVTQEALLKAWSRLDQFSGTRSANGDDFRAWLGRIAGNTSIDLLRQRRDGKVLSLEERRGENEETVGSGIPAHEDNPEENCARREIRKLLAEAIRQLPRDLRQTCLLRDVMQYSSQEVADRLGISLVAVRLRLFRAHRRLREKLHAAQPASARPLDRSAARAAQTARERAQETRRQEFLPLGAAAGYACGD